MTNDLRLSVSKTKTFLDCKKKYHFNYILKLPQKEMSYHISGKFCHLALELFHLSYINGSRLSFNIEMKKAYESTLLEFKDKITKESIKDCKEIISNYLKKLVADGKTPDNLNVLACEKPFNLQITDSISLIGVIDKVEIDDYGMLKVADYKTTKNKKYLKDDWFQLKTYAWILMQEDPSIEKINGSYILLRHEGEEISKIFERDEILEVKDTYLNYANQMLNEVEFAPNPTFLCGWCPYELQCDAAPSKKQQKFGETNWE